MTDNENPVSKSGAVILRHKARERQFEPAAGSDDLEQLSAHIEEWIGPVELVYHELVSDLVHIDVHWIKPSEQRPFHTLVTTGMSDLPMSPPQVAADCLFAELLVELPASWPLSEEAFESEMNYWPVRLLKGLARLPHEYETWLWEGHTVPNGDPAEPYDGSVPFSGAIVLTPVNLAAEGAVCRISDRKTVHFFAVVPLFVEEMNFKLRRGTDALCGRFARAGVNELIDVGRRNVAKRRWFFL